MRPNEYISSTRRAEQAHEMELKALSDPFLAEALEGFEAVDGDHRANIERLEAQITARGKQGSVRRGGIVVGAILIIAAIIFCAVMLIDGSWSVGSSQIEVVTLPEPVIQTPMLKPEAPVTVAVDSTLVVSAKPLLGKEPVDSVALKARRIERAKVRAEQKEAEFRASEAAKTQLSETKNIEASHQDSIHKAVKSTPARVSNIEVSAPTKSHVVSVEQAPAPVAAPSVQRLASFRGGGIDAFRGWVEGRVKAPNIALTSTLSKPIVISFVVDENGRLNDITVVQNPNNELTEQVLKAIRRSPRWEPATTDGKATKSTVTIVTRPERWSK